MAIKTETEKDLSCLLGGKRCRKNVALTTETFITVHKGNRYEKN